MHESPQLKNIKKELARAEGNIQRMREATNFEIFEEAWEGFLTRVARVCNKLQNAFKGNSKFAPWFGSYVNQRKNDELLRYIHHARNVGEHSVQESTEIVPGSHALFIRMPSSGSVTIDYLDVGQDGIYEYRGNQPIEMEVTPGYIRLVPITDSGVTYAPPTQHDGQPIGNPDPVSVANLAFNYYRRLVIDAEHKFS